MSKILFADDDAAMRLMVADVLGSAGHEVRLARNGTMALAEIQRQTPDLVILDYRMGDPDGFAVCRKIKAAPRLGHLPVLILTGENRTDDKLGGFNAGADDYLGKPFDARELLARVTALLRLSERGRDRNPTSGLPGGDAIQREYRRRVARGRPITLTYLDLDHFKAFGDKFGFAIADAAILGVGEALLSAVGEDDFVGHIGGDDFVVISGGERTDELVAHARRAFHQRLATLVPKQAMEAGTFRAQGRGGEEREFPITQLSVAILHLRPPHFPALAELSGEIAKLKKESKEAGVGGTAERDWSGRRG